jgi:hypothetical protein
LRRAATFLRKIGIEIGFGREGRARTRTIYVATTPSLVIPDNAGARSSAPSAPSAFALKPNPANSFAVPGLRTVADHADGPTGGNLSTVRANPLKTNGETHADDADANRSLQSAPENVGWRARL